MDEGYRPIIETSLDVFDSIYSRTDIKALYVPEGQATKALVDDSIDVIVVTRKLSKEEEQYFKDKNGVPARTTAIAHDALAVIIHPANKDTVFTIDQIKGILSGSITKWSQINPKSTLGTINLVFDNAQSGTVRFAQDSILQGGKVVATATAMQTNKDVIGYVGKSKSSIGIIGANWISDTDDSGVQSFLKTIRLADVAKAAGEEGFGPYQAYLATGAYPFKRTVYLINTQNRPGLGMGIASYLAGDQGQRIVLKAGMLPATAPIRIIKTSRE